MKEAIKLALEALELAHPRFGIATEKHKQAITAIKAALAQQADHSEQHLDMVKAQSAQQEPIPFGIRGGMAHGIGIKND